MKSVQCFLNILTNIQLFALIGNLLISISMIRPLKATNYWHIETTIAVKHCIVTRYCNMFLLNKQNVYFFTSFSDG